MQQQVERWRMQQLSGEAAKLTIYRAFIEGELDVPKHLSRRVHDLYFNPQHEEFKPRTIWSLSNAFTSAFKELDPIPHFKATAKLGEFLEARCSQSFQARVGMRSSNRNRLGFCHAIGMALNPDRVTYAVNELIGVPGKRVALAVRIGQNKGVNIAGNAAFNRCLGGFVGLLC